ncbi:MAG: efflux RND transporter periplasmic adaptor subunit [Holosporales bacterium]|nr:efflux RND transporter periplasmic adaptor subunit [Holosporales bacterium]
MKKRYIILWLGTSAIAAITLLGKQEKISYMTEKTAIGNVRKSINAVGEISAIELVNIGAQVGGQITKIYVNIGNKVKQGDMIAKIDATSQQNEIDTNKAKLKSYRGTVKSAEINLQVAKSKYERAQKLLNENFVSVQEFETAKYDYEKAHAALIDAQSLIQQTEILLANAWKNLSYTDIVAPCSGTIVSLPTKVGQTLNASMSAPTIAQIADLSRVQVLMEISEGDVSKIQPGMKVKFSILSDPNRIYETNLKSIDPGPTILTNDKYSGVVDEGKAVFYYGRFEVENPDSTLRIGMTTQNIIELDGIENVLRIPATAVFEKEGEKYANVLVNKKVTPKKITIGISDNIFVEVKSGLAVGDEVVISQMSTEEIAKKENEMPEGIDF